MNILLHFVHNCLCILIKLLQVTKLAIFSKFIRIWKKVFARPCLSIVTELIVERTK